MKAHLTRPLFLSRSSRRMSAVSLGFVLTLLALPACWLRKECQLDGTSCPEQDAFTCDPCGDVFCCAVYQTDGPLEWGTSNWPCECVSAGGTIMYDTATGTGDTACVKAVRESPSYGRVTQP